MVQPLRSRLLITPIKETFKTKSGILIDESGIQAPQSIKAKVVAAGPDCESIKVGDVVLVAQFAPTEAKESPADSTLIVTEEDVLAVIVPDTATK